MHNIYIKMFKTFIKIGIINTILKFGKQNVKFIVLFTFILLLYNPHSINVLNVFLIIPVFLLIVFYTIIKQNVFINITRQPYIDLINEGLDLNLDLLNLLNTSKTFIISALSLDNSFFFNIFNNYESYPLFLLFGLFFLFTTFTSLILISYLGLYGVYLLNLISLCFLWFSILPYVWIIFNTNVFYYISLGKWMYLGYNYRVSFDFLIDNISLSFSFLTLTIAVFVYIYTFSYFRYEPLVDRLVLFLNSFIISMVFLVSSGNFIMMFLGWEMIGLTSFFLINFWSTKVGTLKSAFKAYSFNKTSDIFLFFAIILIFNLTFNLDILVFNQTIHLYKNFFINFFIWEVSIVELISLFFLGSAFIKSAQFGAHIWLPDSMEAPVPASALIHSATLVSAGIYLLLRLNNLFELSNFSINLIAIVGSITALYGGLVSMYQSDTKRILAYSTISHCGFLMVIYTTGVLEYVVLYLYIHGFFKAATFLSVGNVIRFSRNIQDFKRMGHYYKYLPYDCFATFICLINLGGLPLTYGFYIKHLLFVGLDSNYWLYYFVLINCFLGALTGLFYSSRLFFNVFFDIKKSKKTIYFSANRKNLNSRFYINSTIAANISIFSLILVSYSISLYLFFTYTSYVNTQSDLGKYFNYSSYISLFSDSISTLMNFSFINWVVLSLILAIVFTSWRSLSFIYNIYNVLFFSLTFFLFFVFFFKFL